MKKQTLLTSLLILSLILSTPAITLARGDQEQREERLEKLQDRKEKVEARVTKIQERKITSTQKRCEKIIERSNKLLNLFGKSEEARKNNHQNAIDRVNKVIAKLKEFKVDTTKLESDVAELIKKRDAWQTAYTQLLADLKTAQVLDCTQQDQFKTALEKAKTQRETMRKLNQDFWNYMTNTVQVDIKVAKSLLPTRSPSTTPTPSVSLVPTL